MIEKFTLVLALVGLVLPWRQGGDAPSTPSRIERISHGWDFGSMPPDERHADWS